MKLLPVVLIALTSLAAAAPASAGYALKVGGTGAEACFRSAELKAHTQTAIAQCTATLDDAMLPADARVATLVNRGILLTHANRATEAIRDFDDALRLDANQAEAYLNKGVTEYRIGNSAAALQLASRALELRTIKPAIAYYVRGLAAEDRGDVRSAYDDLRRAAALEPKWTEPAIELQRYRVSR